MCVCVCVCVRTVDSEVSPGAVAERDDFLPAEDVYPAGLNGALHIPEPQTAAAVGAEGKHLCRQGIYWHPISTGGGERQE